MARRVFIEGPAGVGKTEHAIAYLRSLLDDGARPEHILVLVPHRALGYAYYAAFTAPDWPGGTQIEIVTFGGLARRGLEVFWPLVVPHVAEADPRSEPIFLTIETAQFFMARFVREAVRAGLFDGVSVTPEDVMRQTLDNLSKAAVNGIPLDQVAARLIAAWGTRHSSRPPVYRASVEVARRFRAYCQQHSLLDFSLQVELYMAHLLHEPLYARYFRGRVRHLVVDNLEENYPVVADFLRWLWDDLDSALLLYDTEAGYRSFLGAAPEEMREMADLCDEVQTWDTPVNIPPEMVALADELHSQLDLDSSLAEAVPVSPTPRAGFTLEPHKFFPQMIDGVVERIEALVVKGTPPGEIVVLAPFLGDSLRFALTTRLAEKGIEAISHRPSRAIRDEPAARAMLTLLALAHPEWGYRPPVADVADTLSQVVADLDPVRAWLLARIVYRPSDEALAPFENIQAGSQARIMYGAGGRYDALRAWLLAYREQERVPPDHFFTRLFGGLLAQTGFGFFQDLEAGRVVAELAESARKFRQTLFPRGATDWHAVSREYFMLVQDGLLAALHLPSWRPEETEAVFLAPAYTFLMRNRRVDVQFWLDAGSALWWERLEQPLTHPYVLARRYPPDRVWTDEDEYSARYRALQRLLVGLARRCRQQVYVAIADLGEQGFEQRGPLLTVFQHIIQRYPHPQAEEVQS